MRGVERKLAKAIEKRLEEGWLVTPTGNSPRQGECCVMMATQDDPSLYFGITDSLTARLGVSLATASAIEAGFEGWRCDYHDPRAYAIGARLRARYCEVDHA